MKTNIVKLISFMTEYGYPLDKAIYCARLVKQDDEYYKKHKHSKSNAWYLAINEFVDYLYENKFFENDLPAHHLTSIETILERDCDKMTYEYWTLYKPETKQRLDLRYNKIWDEWENLISYDPHKL